MKRWPAATNLSAACCELSLPSLSVSGLSIATFTIIPELGSRLEVAKTVLDALNDGSRHTLSGKVWGSTPLVEATESPGTI